MKNLLQIHAGILLANSDLSDLIGPTLDSIENRLTLQAPLTVLRGRLDLLVSQLSSSEAGKDDEEEEALLVFDDKGKKSFKMIMIILIFSFYIFFEWWFIILYYLTSA